MPCSPFSLEVLMTFYQFMYDFFLSVFRLIFVDDISFAIPVLVVAVILILVRIFREGFHL